MFKRRCWIFVLRISNSRMSPLPIQFNPSQHYRISRSTFLLANRLPLLVQAGLERARSPVCFSDSGNTGQEKSFSTVYPFENWIQTKSESNSLWSLRTVISSTQASAKIYGSHGDPQHQKRWKRLPVLHTSMNSSQSCRRATTR